MNANTLRTSPDSRKNNGSTESPNLESSTSVQPGKRISAISGAHGKIEKIEPFIRPPWWTSKTQTQIDDSKNEAKTQYNDEIQKASDALIIYTDGSGINTKIGASACNIDHDQTARSLGRVGLKALNWTGLPK